MSNSHKSFLVLQRCGRSLVAFSLIATLGTGCSKLKEMLGGKKKEPELTIEQTRSVLEVKKIASDRFEAKMAAAEPFNEMGALKTILKEEHNFNMDEVFPKGYDPKALKTKGEVENIIKERATEATNAKFSDKLEKETERLAEIEYPLIKVGDTISVVTNRAMKYKGEVKKIDALVFQLGERELLISDIESPAPGCFHEDTVKKLRDFYMRSHFKVHKEDEFRKQTKQLLPPTMHEFGFIKDDKTWRRIDEYIELHVRSKLNDLAATYREGIAAQARREVESELKAEGLLNIDVPVSVDNLVNEATGGPPPPEPAE